MDDDFPFKRKIIMLQSLPIIFIHTDVRSPSDYQTSGVKFMIQITVNGEKKEFSPGISVLELLKKFDMDERYVAVELNHKIVPRMQFSEKLLVENDTLEIVTFVGGG